MALSFILNPVQSVAAGEDIAFAGSVTGFDGGSVMMDIQF
jgi:hypothetical protein